MATRYKVSEKYKEIISRSSLIHSGSPALYQLRPKIKQFGTLTRKTVGEKNLDKVNKTILLVGETGTGKSTLINALVNYAMGVKFEDDIWFEIVEDEKRSQCESQTSDVVVYEIFGFEGQTLPFSLTIVDTPGFGDTRGIELDVIVSQRLFDLFRSEEGVHELSAVGLVMKASVNRVSDRLRYIFDSVTSLFGNDMEKNIVALITYSDGLPPEEALEALEAAEIKCARDKKNQPVHFLFDNKQKKQRTEMTKRDEKALKHAWEFTQDEMGEFTEFLGTSRPQKLNTTVDVLNSRIRLTACIQNLQERIQLIELKQTEIKQIEEAKKKHDLKKSDKFTVEVDEPYVEKEEVKDAGWRWFGGYSGAVTCNICKENCHYPGCTVALYASHCEVMSGGRCTSCTNKCPASAHEKETWRYVNKTRKLLKVNPAHMENLGKDMKELTAQKTKCLEEAYQHVVKLDEIALNVKSVSTHVHMDYLIEKMKEKGDTEKIKKLEEIDNRVDKKASAGVISLFGKLTAFGKAVIGMK